LLIALACLFALAVAAPHIWQRHHLAPPLRSTADAPSQQRSAVVTLQPEYHSENAIASPSAPIGPPTLPSLDSPLATAEKEEYNTPSDDAQSAEVSLSQAEQPLPLPRDFNFDALLNIRDTLRALVQELPSPTPRIDSSTTPAVSTPRVQVTSEDDRLAMLDRSDRRDTRRQHNEVADPASINEVLTAMGVDELLKTIGQSPLAREIGARLAMRDPPPSPPMTQKVPEKRPVPSLLRHRPTVMIGQLDALATVSPAASSWAEEVLAHVRQLTSEPASSVANPLLLVNELRTLAAAGNRQALELSDPNARHDWRKAAQALERRLGIWHALLDPSLSNMSEAPPKQPGREPMWMPLLSEVASLLAGESNGAAWREYLLLDRVAAAASEGAGIDVKGRRRLAQQVLSRMSDPRLTTAQRQFLAIEPLRNLQQAIRPWAAGPVRLDTLAALIERYEMNREIRYASAIAQLQQRLQWSTDPRYQSLAQQLNQYYRGANMRIALTGQLLNRMIPKQKVVVAPVSDTVVGTKVRGRSRTITQVRVRLLPDPNSWRFGLQAYGTIYSKTHSDTWPFQVRNAAKLHYEAEKVIVINQQGLSISPTKAHARGRSELVDIDTPLDPVPLIGSLMQDLVRQQHQKTQPRAMAQVKSKVVRRAQQRMDREADPKLSRLEQKFRDRVLAPIEQLALVAEPLEMVTTEKRATLKLRLAGNGQLAAHTPRPAAPSDSVVSLQLHETALNNAATGLGLNGRRMTAGELFNWFETKFGTVGTEPPPDLPKRAVIEFAVHDAIHVGCDADRLELVLSIRELSYRRDKILNFQVHAFFRPVLDGLDLRLVRDSTLQFSGRRLRTGPRIVLHSVLGKLLRKEHAVSLLAGKVQQDPRLAGLMITQLVIDDGWIALALGPASPNRTAWRTPHREQRSVLMIR